jgi:hypothetical protein
MKSRELIYTSIAVIIILIFLGIFFFQSPKQTGDTDLVNQTLSQEQMKSAAIEHLSGRISEVETNWGKSIEVELDEIGTNICTYDSEGQLIRTETCWRMGGQNETIRNEINNLAKTDEENLYYNSYIIQNLSDGDGCGISGWEVLITDKGRVILVEEIILCRDF